MELAGNSLIVGKVVGFGLGLIACAGVGARVICLSPQSVQSEPNSQVAPSDPSPPSSQMPFVDVSHASLQIHGFGPVLGDLENQARKSITFFSSSE